MYEKNKRNYRKSLDDYETVLILAVKDAFYNFQYVVNILFDLYFLNNFF